MALDKKHPRQVARNAIMKSLSTEAWNKNWAFTQEMIKMIEDHPLKHHPLIAELNAGSYDVNVLKKFHLEFGYAFAQIFTDAVLQAMGTCSQLERRLGPAGKVSARFLLQLNMLDELGFDATETAEDGGYAGHPSNAHYLKFHETMDQLGLTHQDVLFYLASPYSTAARQTFESSYSDHTALTCTLAVAEAVFDVFAGPWAKNVETRTDVQVEGGYHSIHGLDEDGAGIDDDHSEDMWYVFSQAVTPERYKEMRHRVESILNVWVKFADYLAAA